MTRLRYLWSDRRYLLAKRRQAVLIWVAWHLPEEVAGWAFYRVGAHATTGAHGNTNPAEMLYMTAAERWPSPGRVSR